MRICVAQTKPESGDIAKNIDAHIKLAELAAAQGTDMIVFPELSITGYEPWLATALATTMDDERLQVFQDFSDHKQVIVGVGMPIRTDAGIQIGMIVFKPLQERQLYVKQYLHESEDPFFIMGENGVTFSGDFAKIGLAICYEISVPEHVEQAVNNGASIYLASVAKTIIGIERAIVTLEDIAKSRGITVLLANYVGSCDGEVCGGKSSVWNSRGELLGQLDGSQEGLLIYDTATDAVAVKLQIP